MKAVSMTTTRKLAVSVALRAPSLNVLVYKCKHGKMKIITRRIEFR